MRVRPHPATYLSIALKYGMISKEEYNRLMEYKRHPVKVIWIDRQGKEIPSRKSPEPQWRNLGSPSHVCHS